MCGTDNAGNTSLTATMQERNVLLLDGEQSRPRTTTFATPQPLADALKWANARIAFQTTFPRHRLDAHVMAVSLCDQWLRNCRCAVPGTLSNIRRVGG